MPCGGPCRGQKEPLHGCAASISKSPAVNCVCNLFILNAIVEMSPHTPNGQPLGDMREPLEVGKKKNLSSQGSQ